MTTPKQDRNGVPGPGVTGGNVAQPGPDFTADITRAKGQAERAAAARKNVDQFGPPPAEAGVRDWDQGLAIGEMPGEA